MIRDSDYKLPSIDSSNLSPTEESIADFPSLSSSDAQQQELAKQLRVDAIEQYLFVIEYMRQAGLLWAPVIIWMYVYAFVLILVIIYLFIHYKFTEANIHKVFVVISFSCQVILFTVFPTWNLAHANSLIAPLLELFTMASKKDFTIIGMYVFFLFISPSKASVA